MRCFAPRSSQRWYQAAAFAAVAVVDAGQVAAIAVPVTATARRYRLTVVIGQSHQRLRVLRLTVPAAAGVTPVGWPDRGPAGPSGPAGRSAHSPQV